MINKKVSSVFLTGSLLLSALSVCAGTNFTYQTAQPVQQSSDFLIQTPIYPQNNKLHGSVIMVPAGSTVRATLNNTLSSQTASTGDTVAMYLGSDFNYEGKLIAPAGSVIYGTVIEASKAKHGSMNGKLCVRFNQIATPYGTQIPISGIIKTEDSSGVLVGGTKMDVTKEYAKDLAAGSAAGALSGLVFGALAGGDIGRGAALGTAVGAGGGLAKSVWDMGNDVEIPSGASIDIVLTQPITVSTQAFQYQD